MSRRWNIFTQTFKVSIIQSLHGLLYHELVYQNKIWVQWLINSACLYWLTLNTNGTSVYVMWYHNCCRIWGVVSSRVSLWHYLLTKVIIVIEQTTKYNIIARSNKAFRKHWLKINPTFFKVEDFRSQWPKQLYKEFVSRFW